MYKAKKSKTQTSNLSQANVNEINTTLEKSDDEESVNYIISYQQLYDQVYDSKYDSDSNDYVAAIFYDSANQIEPLNAQIKFRSVQANEWLIHVV